MQDRATQAVKPCDLQRVAVAQHPQDGVKARVSHNLRTAGVIDTKMSLAATPARNSAST